MSLILGFTAPGGSPQGDPAHGLVGYAVEHLDLRGHAATAFALSAPDPATDTHSASDPNAPTQSGSDPTGDARALSSLCDGIILSADTARLAAALERLDTLFPDARDRPLLVIEVEEGTGRGAPAHGAHPPAAGYSASRTTATVSVPASAVRTHHCGITLDAGVERRLDAALDRLFSPGAAMR